MKGFSFSHTTTVLQEPTHVTIEGQTSDPKGKRSPSPESGSRWTTGLPKTFGSFTLGGLPSTSGMGGTNGSGGPPGGPSGSGGDDPGNDPSRGQVPRYRDLVPEARPHAVGALRLEALA